MRKPVFDIGLRLFAVERPQVVGGDDPLTQLLHLRACIISPEFGLADQETLQQRVILELEIRQHAQFLDRALGQVLCLVDDQQGPLARGSGRHQEGLEREQEIGLLEAARWNPEGSGNQSQDVVRIDLGAHELRGDDLRGVQLLEEAAHRVVLPAPISPW